MFVDESVWNKKGGKCDVDFPALESIRWGRHVNTGVMQVMSRYCVDAGKMDAYFPNIEESSPV